MSVTRDGVSGYQTYFTIADHLCCTSAFEEFCVAAYLRVRGLQNLDIGVGCFDCLLQVYARAETTDEKYGL